MTVRPDAAKAPPTESGVASPADKSSPVDIEAGKVRAGLRPGTPVNAKRLDHVNLSVRDLDVSAGFYAALLGLELKEQGYNGVNRWCIIGGSERFYLCLVEVGSSEGFKTEGIHINHVGFVVDDIDETVRRIHALGLRLDPNDATLDWPRSRSAYLKDPDGIAIEITNRFGGGLG
jgi:catechol 2,3-dioxygenase-like lactoylglutathione lyase family enzyme